MGLEIVRALKLRGVSARVMLGPVESALAAEVESTVGRSRVHRYESDRDYSVLLEGEGRVCDIFFSTAAVLDFAFEASQKTKFDKQQIASGLALRPVEDFAAAFGRDKDSDQWLVSFSAEVDTDDRALLERALAKKLSKNAEWTLVNRVSDSSGPHKSFSEAWILDPDQGMVYLGETRSKQEIASELVAEVLRAWNLASAKSQAHMDL
jgi:phosphopantothenoylcysteine synthetase/decarboxylase